MKRRFLAMNWAVVLAVHAMVIFPNVSDGQPAVPGGRPYSHFGEIADPSVWPVSAVGTITVPWNNVLLRCTGALVAPNVVLTAAHCLSFSGRTAVAQPVHFSAGLNRGVPSNHSVAERFEIGEGYNPVDGAAALRPEAVVTTSGCAAAQTFTPRLVADDPPLRVAFSTLSKALASGCKNIRAASTTQCCQS